jgi:cysteinyl-tRNA synthetase
MKNLLNIWIMLFLSLFITGCSGGSGSAPSYTPAPVTPTVRPDPLAGVKTWAIQLQNINEGTSLDELVDSKYDLLVLDPTRTDWLSEYQDFDTKSMVQRLKETGGGNLSKKIVIAYVNIGQAENWQWYWTWSRTWPEGEAKPSDWPDYIITSDPDGWEGNYPVAYWDSDWQDIIIYGQNQNSEPYGDYTSALDEIIKDGFDGIYMDWVAGYEDSSVIARAEKDGKDAGSEMVKFINQIRTYCHSRKSDFIIIQQNGSSLFRKDAKLFDYIDAISQESIWYGASGGFSDWNDPSGYDERNDEELTDYYVTNLNNYLKAGMPVLDVEYAVDFASDAYGKSKEKGYIPYCTRRSLSRLTTTVPPDYK